MFKQMLEIKIFLFKLLNGINDFYNFLNLKLLFLWRYVLNKQSDNRYTFFFKTLIEKPATALALNTILFYILATFLAGGNGLIGHIFNNIALINIVMFLLNLLGWTEKLKKYASIQQ